MERTEAELIAAVFWKAQRALQAEDLAVATARQLNLAAMRRLLSHGLLKGWLNEGPFGGMRQSWELRPLPTPCGKGCFLKVPYKAANLACGNPTRLRAFPVLRPELDEQKEIPSIFQTIDHKLSFHERKRGAIPDLFPTLPHLLMTAEIRVDMPDMDTREMAA